MVPSTKREGPTLPRKSQIDCIKQHDSIFNCIPDYQRPKEQLLSKLTEFITASSSLYQQSFEII